MWCTYSTCVHVGMYVVHIQYMCTCGHAFGARTVHVYMWACMWCSYSACVHVGMHVVRMQYMCTCYVLNSGTSVTRHSL